MANQIEQFKAMLDKSIETAKQARFEEDRRRLMSTIGQDLAKMLAPVLSSIASTSKNNKEDLRDVMNEIMGEVSTLSNIQKGIDTAPIITAIEEAFGNVYIPQPKVEVTVPDIKIPEIRMPDEMNVKGWVSLMGVDLNNPLPVQLRDAKGNAINLYENLTQIVGGGGGGFKVGRISNIENSAYGVLLNADNRLRISVETGSTGLTDTELRASAVPVSQVSGANWSVSVADVFATTAASNVVNPDNRVKVELVGTQTVSATALDIRNLVNATDSISAYQSSGAVWSVSVNDAFRTTVASNMINSDDRLRVSLETSGLTDTELRASSVPVAQASGAIWSVEASQVNSWLVSQVSGANWTVNITDVFATTVASNVVNPDNRVKTELVGTVTVDGSAVTQPVSVASTLLVNQVSGANWSVEVTSVTPGTGASNLGKAEDAAHASADVGVMALSVRNSTNTTFASADGDYQPIASDGIGRPIVRPVQTRGLLQTAYVSISTGTETTLLAGAASTYFDLIYAMATNSSDAAVTVDLRSATTGGIQTSIRVPANGTAGVSMSVPIPQDVAADTWTADMPDITGTTVTIGALFSREV